MWWKVHPFLVAVEVLFISIKTNFKLRNDFKIYKYKESVFIGIINRRVINTIVGYIYRYPCMEVIQFNDVFLQNILERLSYESKEIILMDDFHIDILKYDANSDSATFLDNMYENIFLPYITCPLELPPGHKHY